MIHFDRWGRYICNFHHINVHVIASFRLWQPLSHHCTAFIFSCVIQPYLRIKTGIGQVVKELRIGIVFSVDFILCRRERVDFLKTYKRKCGLKSCQRASASRSAVIRSLLWIAWIYTDGRITMKTGRWDFLKNINPTIIPSHSIPSHVETHTGTAPRPFHKQGSHEQTALGEIMCGDME